MSFISRFSVTSDHSELGVKLYAAGEEQISAWGALPITSLKFYGERQGYPNTPLFLLFRHQDAQESLLVGCRSWPTMMRVLMPRHPKPSPAGRFSVLPVDGHRFLIADSSSHQVYLANHTFKTRRHIAGSGKNGYLDGPLDICRMHSPTALALDPHTHMIYVADKGNHRIRRIDLSSGLMSTVCGNGTRGHCDSADKMKQSLDSPFEISFKEPHALVISCANNCVRHFDLSTAVLSTVLIG